MKRLVVLIFFSISSLFAFEDLTLENFEEKTIGKKVILDFYTKGWSACEDLGESLTIYNTSKENDVYIYKIDMLIEKELAQEFSVKILPTLIYFRDDEIKEREVGRKTPEQIKRSVQEYLIK